MPPKVDTSKEVRLRTFVFGGDKSLPPSMSQKLGPLGLNAKKVGEDIATATKAYKGIRLFVVIVAKDRQCKVELAPGVSSMIVKEMGGYERDKKKPKIENRTGNISFQQVLKIAKIAFEDGRSLSKTLEGTVKEVLGSCLGCGCTVDGQSPKEITKKINNKEIKC